MVNMRNITELETIGLVVAGLEAKLEAARTKRSELLVKCYNEGWTWDELTVAGSASLSTVRNTLTRAGALLPMEKRVKSATPVERERKAMARQQMAESAVAETD